MEQMTPEQAIQEIQTYMYRDCYLDAPSNDACKLAISALEKQVPKKPTNKNNIEGVFEEVADSGSCPNCGAYLVKIAFQERVCTICGQALDWPE